MYDLFITPPSLTHQTCAMRVELANSFQDKQEFHPGCVFAKQVFDAYMFSQRDNLETPRAG